MRQRKPESLIPHLQWLAAGVIAAATIAAGGATIAGLFGYLPVLNMPLTFAAYTFPEAGVVVQVGVVVLLLTLLAAQPSGFRVLALERTHRDFSICMSDVADAYRVCHAADRAGAFTLSNEFDAVKERIQFLNSHPDLGNLEPDVLEAAAQMSHASRELAEIYSDEAIARARGYLDHRQEEIELFRARIDKATSDCHELRRRTEAAELEEATMESRLDRLHDEFGDMLHDLGYVRRKDNVVSLPPATAAE